MIDLHTHILPGVDDGAPDMETSLAMARAAHDAGVGTLVATPHVNSRYEQTSASIARRVGELNLALARAGVPVAVVTGAEVSLSSVSALDLDELAALCVGNSDCLLVESPYRTDADYIEDVLFDIQLKGLRPMLAHPERAPVFQRDVERLARIVDRGVLCSITAGSLAGRFGGTVYRFALQLVERGLVHNIASDMHDVDRRPPGLLDGLRAGDEDLPGLADQARWFTDDAPMAILQSATLPDRPDPPQMRRRGLRRIVRGH